MSTPQSKKNQLLRDGCFSAVKRNEPNRVRVVREKHGQKAADKVAAGIALDMARKMGAKL